MGGEVVYGVCLVCVFGLLLVVGGVGVWRCVGVYIHTLYTLYTIHTYIHSINYIYNTLYTTYITLYTHYLINDSGL